MFDKPVPSASSQACLNIDPHIAHDTPCNNSALHFEFLIDSFLDNEMQQEIIQTQLKSSFDTDKVFENSEARLKNFRALPQT
jgi:hypothetical protein